MKTNDLSIGHPASTLIKFALPMILSVTLQQIYNIADSAIAGQMISSDALAAVSASYPITMIYLAIATGLGVGSGVITSLFFGRKDYKNTRTSITTSLIFTLAIALIMTLIGVLITDVTLNLISTPANIFADSAVYLRFYCFGLTFTYLYNVITCIFQSLGNSRTPLYFLIFSTFFNILLDILFVGPCNMGVMGLALGTFIAQGVATILSGLFLLRSIRKSLVSEEKADIFSRPILKDILSVALPSILQGSTISLGNFFIQKNINSYGSDLIAGYGAAYKITYVIVNIFSAFSNAVATYTSQNIGAGKEDRVHQGLKYGLIMSLSFAIFASILFVIFPDILLKIFMGESSTLDAFNYGKTFIYIVTPFFIVSGLKLTIDGVLKGAKDMLSFVLGTSTDLVLRIIFSYVLSYPFGYQGIFWAWPLGWVIGTIVTIIMFFTKRWRKTSGLAFKKVD